MGHAAPRRIARCGLAMRRAASFHEPVLPSQSCPSLPALPPGLPCRTCRANCLACSAASASSCASCAACDARRGQGGGGRMRVPATPTTAIRGKVPRQRLTRRGTTLPLPGPAPRLVQSSPCLPLRQVTDLALRCRRLLQRLSLACTSPQLLHLCLIPAGGVAGTGCGGVGAHAHTHMVWRGAVHKNQQQAPAALPGRLPTPRPPLQNTPSCTATITTPHLAAASRCSASSACACAAGRPALSAAASAWARAAVASSACRCFSAASCSWCSRCSSLPSGEKGGGQGGL